MARCWTVLAATMVLAACGNSAPPLRTRATLTVDTDAGTSRHVTLHEVICRDGAWTQGTAPVDAVLVSACCMVTTDPIVAARGPSESPVLTIAAGAVPRADGGTEITTEDLAEVCATMPDDGLAVLPRPEVSTPGYDVSTVAVTAGSAVQVDVDGSSVAGVVVDVDGARFTVEYVPDTPRGNPSTRRVGVVLTRDGTGLLGLVLHTRRVPGLTARAVAVGAADLDTTLHQCGVLTSEPVCHPVARTDRWIERAKHWSAGQVIEGVAGLVLTLAAVALLTWWVLRGRAKNNVRKDLDP